MAGVRHWRREVGYNIFRDKGRFRILRTVMGLYYKYKTLRIMSYLHIACHTTQHDFRGRLIHWIEDGATTLRGRYILNPQRCISDDEHDKKCKRKKIFILIIPHHVKKKGTVGYWVTSISTVRTTVLSQK